MERGEGAGGHHPWAGNRNAGSRSPGELDPPVNINERHRARPAVRPALPGRASSSGTESSLGADNNDLDSSGEPAGYATYVRRAGVVRTTEHLDGGDVATSGRDGGGISATNGTRVVHGPGRSSSRVRDHAGERATAATCGAGGGGNGSEDVDANCLVRPSRHLESDAPGSRLVSKELEVEWVLDEAFSMAMAGLRGPDRIAEITARRPAPTTAGKRDICTEKEKSDRNSTAHQGSPKDNVEKGKWPVKEGSSVASPSVDGGGARQDARGAPKGEHIRSLNSQSASQLGRNWLGVERDAQGVAAQSDEEDAVAARRGEGKQSVGAVEEAVYRLRVRAQSNPSQEEETGEAKVPQERNGTTENLNSVNRPRRRGQDIRDQTDRGQDIRDQIDRRQDIRDQMGRGRRNHDHIEGRTADDQDLGVEVGSSGVWEHVTGEGKSR